jgi:ABC-2 type transport system ATP-binding protein
LKELIRGFATRGTAVLYCSHVLDVVEKVCDRALILAKGRMQAVGTLAELRTHARGTTLEDVFRTVAAVEDPVARADRLLRVLDGA